jgi:N-acetylglucosamine kinase-like BadF-type ATPase
MTEKIILALEGGGSRSQAALLDGTGKVLGIQEAEGVNTNFVSTEMARLAVQSAVQGALQASAVDASAITHFVTSLVGASFGPDTFGSLFPGAKFHSYPELRVVFARAGLYRPHGVGLVAATGATAWVVRGDDGRELFAGGWGSLLGDEGSAYAMGLQALRSAARAYEGRLSAPTDLVAGVCHHFQIAPEHFREELVRLAYHPPLSRADIAGLAPLVTRLAQQGDPIARIIVAKTAADLADLSLFAAGRLFTPAEVFDVVIAGGLVNAGEVLLSPLRQRLAEAFPHLKFQTGSEAPAVALGRLALHNLEETNFVN